MHERRAAYGLAAGIAVVALVVVTRAPAAPSPAARPHPIIDVARRRESRLNGSVIATASVPVVPVFDEPGAVTPSRTFENPWFMNDDRAAPVPLVFAVKSRRVDGWTEVLLPTRPNGSTGWVRDADVTLSATRYRITVELSAHRLRAYEGSRLLVDDDVATGAPDTPTPTGQYYVVALLKSTQPDTVYGPFAYGLSGHSAVLETFDGSDGEIGIHGNNDASVLGTSVSHGCIRMSNDGISKLATVLPLGTPVTIDP